MQLKQSQADFPAAGSVILFHSKNRPALHQTDFYFCSRRHRWGWIHKFLVGMVGIRNPQSGVQGQSPWLGFRDESWILLHIWQSVSPAVMQKVSRPASLTY